MRCPPSYTGVVTNTDDGILACIDYCRTQGWILSVDHTVDGAPDNHFWEHWGLPILDPDDPDLVLHEVNACREAFPEHYIRINAYEARKGQAHVRHTVLVHAPASTEK